GARELAHARGPGGATRAARRSDRRTRAEDRDRARGAVQEAAIADEADLAVAEEAAERERAQVAAQRLAVVIRDAVEPGAAPEAREEQRAARRAARARRGAVAGEPLLEVLGRGARVAQVELHHLPRAERGGH